jgi:hypothetical protein
MQKLLGDLDDILILLLVVYISLVFFGLLKYPNEKWKAKAETLKNGKYGIIAKLALPALMVLLIVKIVMTVNQ